ncbi:MAG: SH3 domain-containing protein [Desulfobacterales bacterium]|jgi:SH3-like domain-containing protein
MNKYIAMKPHFLMFILLIVINAGSALAERLTIIAAVANIRSGPASKSDILWKVEKYYPIFVIKKSDSWYYFRDFEDDRGWVHKSLVGNVPSIITKKDLCNIRSGPSTKDKILFTIEKGIPFKVLEKKGRWVHIEHADGDSGWIFDGLVW